MIKLFVSRYILQDKAAYCYEIDYHHLSQFVPLKHEWYLYENRHKLAGYSSQLLNIRHLNSNHCPIYYNLQQGYEPSDYTLTFHLCPKHDSLLYQSRTQNNPNPIQAKIFLESIPQVPPITHQDSYYLHSYKSRQLDIIKHLTHLSYIWHSNAPQNIL